MQIKMTFDSIDSKQDFKGHVTIKVGNSTYNINFVTGDKTHTREETLNSNGMIFGRYTYLQRHSPNKLVVSDHFDGYEIIPCFDIVRRSTINSTRHLPIPHLKCPCTRQSIRKTEPPITHRHWQQPIETEMLVANETITHDRYVMHVKKFNAKAITIEHPFCSSCPHIL